MNVEFVDTNVLVYAHDSMAGSKQHAAARLLARLTEEQAGALSIQVCVEFYAAATRKLGIAPHIAQDAIAGLSSWKIHSLAYADLFRASQLHRQHKISWWDALLITSAIQLGCHILWTEDLSHGRSFGSLTIRNPFHEA